MGPRAHRFFVWIQGYLWNSVQTICSAPCVPQCHTAAHSGPPTVYHSITLGDTVSLTPALGLLS